MPDRVARALLFTDVVDSTRWVEQLGDAGALARWTAHDRAARDLLARHGGREIDRSDGFFLLFDDVAAAVRFAAEYHVALAALGMAARAGVHFGEVTLRVNAPGDVARGAKPLEVEGLAKPFAARLMALAPGGRTLLSASARAALAEPAKPAARVISRGHYRLKGVAEPTELFELLHDGHDAGAPPADTDKAYRVVRDGDLWRPVREVRHNLPAERDAFVGRADELAALAARLADGARLVTVAGTGGTGKTRLVRRYGLAWLGDWPGGVYFCDLSEARGADGICFAVAAALGILLADSDAVQRLAHAIAGRGRCLVILDNFEQVVGQAAATLGRWLDAAAQAAFVVTSRERLHLPGETVLPVEPLPLASDAMTLFAARAQAQRPGFALDASNRAAVAEVVRLLDGLPLAIELAAARVRVLSPAQLVDRLRDRFVILAGARGAGARQATLRAAIDWSWQLLAPWEQAALAQCSVFEGGFTLEAAEAVVELAAWPPAGPALDVVQALVDKSLLRTWVPPGAPRLDINEPYFGMYMSIHEFAAERLAASGAEAASTAQRRHGDWYARAGSDEAIRALSRHGSVARLKALTLEADNLAAALRRAAARSDGQVAAACFRALWEVLFRRGPFAPGVELGRLAAAVPGLPPRLAAQVRIGLALALRRVGQSGDAKAVLDEALMFARASGDTAVQGEVRHNIALAQTHAGEVESALRLQQEALSTFVAAGDRMMQGLVLANLGNLLMDGGRPDEGIDCYQRALAAHREVGNRRAEGIALSNLGAANFDLGRLAEARAHLDAALAIDRETGSRLTEGIALCNLANLHEQEERIDEAVACNEAALAIFREIGGRRDEGIVLSQLARIRHEQGRIDEARALYDAALAIHRAVGNRRHEAGTLTNLGEMLLVTGDPAAADAVLREGEALLRALGDLLSLAELVAVRGRVHVALGDRPAARAALADAQAAALALEVGPASSLGATIARLEAALAADPAGAQG